MADLISQFTRTVAANPDCTAIVNADGSSVSFAALHARAAKLANTWAKAGIGQGDRVLVAMGISSDLYATLAALWSLGATVVLPEPALGLAGVRHAVRTANVTAFCATGWYVGLRVVVPELWFIQRLALREADHGELRNAIAPTDIALISFTSGTTGAPKAIPRSHAFLMAQHDAVAPLLESDMPERDLVAFPVFALINLAAGRTSVLPNWNMSRLADLGSDQLADWIKDQNVSRALLPPALCTTLSQTQRLPSLRKIFTGGGPVFPDMVAALRQAHPEVHVTCVYGSTEAEPITHLDRAQISDPDQAAMKAGKGLLVGKPTATTSVRIVEDEILVAGDHVNQGYLDPRHDAENKLHENGKIWHRTGDAGRFDDHGRLWLLGRIGTDVCLNEQPTFPFSVEVAVRQWPGVESCALISANGTPTLVICGDKTGLQTWVTSARALGISEIRHVTAIPMDRRHASKVDRKALLLQLKA
ncbi:MAG: AMP-binding protein [Yoonia sp.]|uniref:AMP-binding protein n=1 Tax=Yoonia sp. TaxID=2212373 RepID=UPI00326637FC